MQGSKLVYMPNQLLHASFEIPIFSLIFFFENETKCKKLHAKWERRDGIMEQKGSKKKAEMNEEKRKKGGANSSKECWKKVKEEAENDDERGQPTKRIVG